MSVEIQEIQANNEEVKKYLLGCIVRNTTTEAVKWMEDNLTRLKTEEWERHAYLTFSTIPRKMGKSPMQLNDQDLESANKLRRGWKPTDWTLDRTARVYLILALPMGDFNRHKKALNTLFSSADVGELVALYSSLPLLPHPSEFRERAAEGIRTNMTVVFDCIVLDNPYPADYLSEAAWNQMVLKAVFVGRPLYKIYGLDQRNNLHLAEMLSDYVHERWAAGRTVTPEIWRLIAPFVSPENNRLVEDITRGLNDADILQQEGAGLALSETNGSPGMSLLAIQTAITSRIASKAITWQSIADQWYAAKR